MDLEPVHDYLLVGDVYNTGSGFYDTDMDPKFKVTFSSDNYMHKRGFILWWRCVYPKVDYAHEVKSQS